MNNAYPDRRRYFEDLARIAGQMLGGGAAGLPELAAREDATSGVFLPLASARRALGLREEETALLALWTGAALRGESAQARALFSARCAALAAEDINPLFAALLVSDGRGGARPSLFTEDFLLGREPRLPEGMALEFPDDAAPFHDASLPDEIAAAVRARGNAPLAVALAGDPGCGRTYLLRVCAARLGRPLIAADMAKPFSAGDARELTACALLTGALPCLRGYPGRGTLDASALAARLGILFLTAQAVPRLCGAALLAREVCGPRGDEAEQAVRTMLGDIPFAPGVRLEEIPRAVRRSPGSLARLAGRLEAERLLGAVGPETLCRAARETEGGTLPAAAKRIETVRETGELVLPDAQRAQFRRLCALARARRDVMDAWGFARRLPCGRGMTALFYGASGTGKTMAAGILAREIGYELWRVDLAQTVSKYIGETQKNLAAVFAAAEGRDCVLLFDEADALFSRRSEVSDAQDRYANAEIACLLQQTEQFEGVTVLSTNLFQNFDEAFRRRITHVIRFPSPDIPARERLWRGAFPPETPRGPLDWRFLAEQFELTGAGIQSCAVYAACLARSEGRGVEMGDVIEAVRGEYEKSGRAISAQISRQFPFPSGGTNA